MAPFSNRLHRHVVLMFVLALLVRFLAFHFYDDHFDHLSIAVQLLDGELPVRDFVDLGRPLKYLISAAGQATTGRTLLAEALLISVFLAAGAALTGWAAARAAGSVWLGWFAAILVVGVFSREYGYPRVILPAVGVCLLWHYVEDTRWRSLLALSGFTVAAFLIRYDYGFYLGVLSGVAIVGRAWTAGLGTLTCRVTVYGLASLLLVSPYIGYLALSGGFGGGGPGVQSLVGAATVSAPRIDPFPPTIVLTEALPERTVGVRWAPGTRPAVRAAKEEAYRLSIIRQRDSRTSEYELADPAPENLAALVRDPNVEDTAGFDRGQLRFDESRLERWRRELGVPRIHLLPDLFTESNTQAILYYLLMLVPVASLGGVALVASGRLLSRSRLPWPGLQLGIVAVLGLFLNLFLIRGNVDSRLGDVIVPPAVLAAWLISVILTGRRRVPSSRFVDRTETAVELGLSPRPELWRPLAAAMCAVVLMLWVMLYGGAVTRVRQAGVVAGPIGIVAAIGDRVRVLGSDPIDYLAPEGAIEGSRSLIRYVRQCVDEQDRVLSIEYMPELFYAARRRFAGGMVAFSHWVDAWRLWR